VVYIIFILKKINVYFVEPKRIKEKKSCPETSFTSLNFLHLILCSGQEIYLSFSSKVKEKR